MRGSNFPNGVLVDRSALRNTEISKAEEILRNRTTITSRGVYSGFVVSVNVGDDTLIDVTLGTGFAPDGSYIATTSNYFGIALDDYTLNAVNYLCAVYTEANTHNAPHESDGVTYATRADASYRIRVYSAANYAALAATDANLANDARDRMLILATITGNGSGPPISSLFPGNISSPITYSNLLYATPSELVTITGVTVTAATTGTSTGTGTIEYIYAVGPTYTLQWTPAGGVAGAAVPITADGSYNLLDSTGQYITVYVVVPQLPTTGTFPMVESIVITNLYYQAIPRFTGEDVYHRNLIGTGTISPENPHGTSIADIAGDTIPQLEEHQDVMHCNGIWREDVTGVLNCSVTVGVGVSDTLNIQAPVPSDLYYINGNKLNSIVNATIPFVTWLPEWGAAALSVQTNFFEIYSTDTGIVKAHRKASYPAAPRNLRGTWIVDMSPNYPAGNYILWYDVSPPYTRLRWAGGPIVSLTTTDFGTAGHGRAVRLFDLAGVHWIDLWVNMDQAKGANDWEFNAGVLPLTDNITVVASVDWDTNMQLASIPYWWDSVAVPPKANIGYAPYDPTRRVVDKRPFGTLCKEVISDSALQDLVYHQQDELQYSGILWGRYGDQVEFRVLSAVLLTLGITGGAYYCRGQRLAAVGNASVGLHDNATNLVWLDMAGAYQVIDVTTTFAGDLQAAMSYVLGSNAYIPATDDQTHYSDLRDPPERGVLLYVAVTAAGVISYYEEVTRNVNGPVDPWSVAARSASTALGRSAAFNSLYAAFAYAALYNRLNSPTINIIGYTEINNARIVQPTGVVVNGGKGGTTNEVVVNFADIDGAWCLSEGCKVLNVDLVAGANGVAVFGLATALVTSSDDVTVEDCRFDCGAYVTNTYFMRIGEAGFAGVSVSNLVLQNNRVTAGTSLITYNAGLIDFYNFVICNNIVNIIGTATTSYAIRLRSLTTSTNMSIHNNVVAARYGVLLQNATDSKIYGNFFAVGYNAASSSRGVELDTVINTDVFDNSFSVRAANASLDLCGIYTHDMTNCSIHHNNIQSMHYGICDTGTATSTVLLIDSNIVYVVDNGAGMGGVGIATYCDAVIVSNNRIYAEAAGIACGPSGGGSQLKIIGNMMTVTTVNGVGTVLPGWGVGPAGSAGITFAPNSSNLTIENNKINLVGVATVLLSASAGILVDTCSNFVISGNTTTVGCTTLSGGSSSYHIWVLNALPNCSFTIEKNRIDNRNNIGAPGISPLYGLYVYDAAGDGTIGKISDNLVDGSRGGVLIAPFDTLVFSNAGAHIVFSNNVLANVGAVAVPSYSLTGARYYTNVTSHTIHAGGSAGII